MSSVEHRGYRKFEDQVLVLDTASATHRTLQTAQQWARKTSRRLVLHHDQRVTLAPDDYRMLSERTSSNGLAPGNPEDFEKSGRRAPRFRTKRRRK